MLNILLESRAARSRRLGGTMASAVVHVALFIIAVVLTLPRSGEARGNPPEVHSLVYVPMPDRPRAVTRSVPRSPVATQAIDHIPATITLPRDIPDHLPPIDIGPVLLPDEIRIGAAGTRIATATGANGLVGRLPGAGDVIESSLADRPPRLVGRVLEPRYPARLRETGVEGRVVVQFVVDTLGRAEIDEVRFLEVSHPLFADAVRRVLARYRFTPGEAAGHRVRTRVQIPFDFTLRTDRR